MKNLTLPILLLLAVFFVGCAKSSLKEGKEVTPRCAGAQTVYEDYIVGPDDLCLNATGTYNVAPYYYNGGGYVTWSVDQPGIATIQANGTSATVTRIAAGSFKVKAYVWTGSLCSSPQWLNDKTVIDGCQSPVSGTVYDIVSALDENYKLGVYSATYSPLHPNGGNAVLTYKNLVTTGYYAGYYHRWTLTGSGNSYSIKFYNFDDGLKVSGSNTPILSNSYPSYAPAWTFTSTGDGYYTIGDPGTGLKLTAPTSGMAGSQLQLANASNGLNQKWKILPVFPANDPAKYVTMTIVPDGFTGDIVFADNTTLEQFTVSNIVPGVPQTILIKTPSTSYHTYKVTFTNSSQTSTTYVSLHNHGGGASLAFTGLQYTTNNSQGYPQDYNLWTLGGPYVLKISKNGFIDHYENP